MENRRTPSSPRKAVNLTVKLNHQGVDEFVEKYATNLSAGGLFIRTRDPKPVGTQVQFKVEIAQGRRVLQGSAQVKWARGADDPAGPPGMGLEFTELDDASHALVKRMLAGPGSSAPAPPPPPIAAVAPVAPVAPVVRPAPLPVPVVPRVPAPKAQRWVEPSTAPLVIRLDDAADDAAPAVEAPPAPAPVAAPLPAAVAAPAPSPATPEDLPPEWAPEDPEAAIDLEFDLLLATTPEPPRDLPPKVVVQDDAFEDPTLVETASVVVGALLEGDGNPGEPVFLKPEGEISSTGPVIGIDLGTSKACCAFLVNGKPVLLAPPDESATFPSAVAVDASGQVVVGEAAVALLTQDPTRTVWGAKRLVGRDYDSAVVQDVLRRSFQPIVRDREGRVAVELGDHLVSLEEVQGLVLRACRQLAERALGQPVSRAVITCPADYSEQQREALRRAATMAGLKTERLVNEPTAAALAYSLDRGLARKVLVCDLGAGNFDATVLRIDGNVLEVLATRGDLFLGGIDFDHRIAEALLGRFEEQHGVEFSGEAQALTRVAREAERAKVALSDRSTVDVSLLALQPGPHGPLDLKTQLTRDAVHQLCGDLVDRAVEVAGQALAAAQLSVAQLDDVILVGAMGRMPLVRQRFKAAWNKTPNTSIDLGHAVAMGAALVAGTVDKVSSVVLIDVVPMGIGLAMPDGTYRQVIEKNAPLPAVATVTTSGMPDDGQSLELNFFQGDAATAEGNDYLGSVRIEDLPKRKKAPAQVTLTVKLDADCVLHVEAREQSQAIASSAILATRFTRDEIRARLAAASKAEPAEDVSPPEPEPSKGKFWGFWKRS